MRSSSDGLAENRLTGWLAALQILNIYTAAGVASFGWSLAHLLGFRCGHYLPLWFFGTLFIYNLDRLKQDPADAINSPQRTRSIEQFRKTGARLTVISASLVLLFPILERDWLLLGLAILAGIVAASYSVAIFGARVKTIPVLKTFFVPLFITAAFLAPALLLQTIPLPWCHLLPVATWTFLVLLFDVFLCDQRDVQGDASTGIRTLPVVLGSSRSQRFLALLLSCIVLLSAALILQKVSSPAWPWVAGLMLPSLAVLLGFSRKPQHETFYEWWVGGLLFLPLAGCLFSHIQRGLLPAW